MNYLFPLTAIAVFVLLGVIFLLAPTLHRGLLFGHTVEADFAVSPDGQFLLRRYRLLQLVLLAAVFAAFFALQSLTGAAQPWPMLACLVFYVAVASTIWAWAFRRTRPHAVRVPLVRTATLTTSHRLDVVHLAALLPLALTALLLALDWSRIPASFPIHWNAAGVPNGWVHRTPAAVFSPLLIAALVVLALWLALRYATPGNTRVRWVIPALAWCIAAFGSIMALLPLRSNVAALPLALLLVMPAIILVVCGVAVAASFRQPQAAEHGDGTPDSRWIGGILYYNPRDPALWVEKRFGIGWTLNFARPASWFMLGGILLVVIVGAALGWRAHR